MLTTLSYTRKQFYAIGLLCRKIVRNATATDLSSYFKNVMWPILSRFFFYFSRYFWKQFISFVENHCENKNFSTVAFPSVKNLRLLKSKKKLFATYYYKIFGIIKNLENLYKAKLFLFHHFHKSSHHIDSLLVITGIVKTFWNHTLNPKIKKIAAHLSLNFKQKQTVFF